MKVTVVAVISADAKLTRGDESAVHTWASKEDQQHLQSQIAEHDGIVFGSGTYEAMDGKFDLVPRKLRVVLTHDVNKYVESAVPGQLEFMNHAVVDLISTLEQRDIKKLLVAGGPQMIADFLQAKLVDEVYLTIEPRFFGSGKSLLPDTPLDINLQLISSRTLNSQGTTLVHYKVIR